MTESEKGLGVRRKAAISPHPGPRMSVAVRVTWPLLTGHELIVRRQEEKKALLSEGPPPLRSCWLEPWAGQSPKRRGANHIHGPEVKDHH